MVSSLISLLTLIIKADNWFTGLATMKRQPTNSNSLSLSLSLPFFLFCSKKILEPQTPEFCPRDEGLHFCAEIVAFMKFDFFKKFMTQCRRVAEDQILRPPHKRLRNKKVY